MAIRQLDAGLPAFWHCLGDTSLARGLVPQLETMNSKIALITGVLGQDGSYLAEWLKAHGCRVVGIDLAPAAPPTAVVDAYVQVDLLDRARLLAAVAEIAPDEIYHLAGVSVVSLRPEDELAALQANVLGLHHLLAAALALARRPRLFFAGSSEMFGDAGGESPQSETSPTWPRSVYGITKLAGFHLVRHYRRQHGLFACTGILFNHESPRRPERFVTMKVARAAARIAAGIQPELRLGSLDAVRDWGYAPDYVEAMWRILQAPVADDYVIATGEGHTVEELVSRCFARHGLEWRRHVVIDPALQRPPEAVASIGNPGKIRADLGWSAVVRFDDLVGIVAATPHPL